MNLPEMYALRKRMEALCSLCDTLEEKGFWIGSGRIPFREAFRMDLANFCMYISASDGRVSGGEVLFFKVALGFDTSIDELISTIKEQGIYSESFETKVPLTIKTLVSAERELAKAGIDVDGITDNFVDFYYDLGCGMIQADDVADNELRDLNIYMSTIYNYAGSSNRRIAERQSSRSSSGSSFSATSVDRTGPILSNLDFDTVRVNGFGNKVVSDVELPSCAMLVTAKHSMGDSNFSVCYYDGDGNRSSYFVNEIGNYEGTILFNNSRADEGSGIIEVEADGKWSLEFIAIPRAVGLSGSSNIKGRGCTVGDAFVGNGKPNVVKVKHDGDSNFCVRIISEDGDNKLLINEIGFYSGEKVMKLEKGVRYFILVEADGNWSVDVGIGDSQQYCELKENIY